MKVRLKKYDFGTLKAAYGQDRGLVASYPSVVQRLLDGDLLECCEKEQGLQGLLFYKITYAGKRCVEQLGGKNGS